MDRSAELHFGLCVKAEITRTSLLISKETKCVFEPTHSDSPAPRGSSPYRTHMGVSLVHPNYPGFSEGRPGLFCRPKTARSERCLCGHQALCQSSRSIFGCTLSSTSQARTPNGLLLVLAGESTSPTTEDMAGVARGVSCGPPLFIQLPPAA